MKRTTIALSLVTALSVGTYFATAPSAACCGDGAIAATGATSAGATVSAAISAATGTIVTNLQLINDTLANGFGKTYAEMAKQTAATKTIEEGAIQAQTALYMADKEGQALVAAQVSPRACYELQAATAIGQADSTQASVVQSITKTMTDRTLYTPNTAGAISSAYRTHTSKFCSDEDVRLGRCNTAAPADLQNADIRADNLIARDVLNPDQQAAASAFIQNVLNPIPTQMLPKGWESTDAGKTFIAGQMAEQGRTSVAANSFAHMAASRHVQPGLGTAAGLNVPDISMRQLIRSQADGRFLSPKWYEMLAGMTSEHNLLRELNKQMAFSLWMDYQAYEQNERIEAVLATDMAINAKRDSEARLAQARQAASKARAN